MGSVAERATYLALVNDVLVRAGVHCLFSIMDPASAAGLAFGVAGAAALLLKSVPDIPILSYSSLDRNERMADRPLKLNNDAGAAEVSPRRCKTSSTLI